MNFIASEWDFINANAYVTLSGVIRLNNRIVYPVYAKELITKAGKAGDSEAINFLMSLY